MISDYDLKQKYLQSIEKMLSLGKLRIADIYPIVRLIQPHLYRIALKTSCLISKERFLEDMHLLKNDICNYEKRWQKFFYSGEIPQNNKQELMDIFDRYLKRNRFDGDSDVEQFKMENSRLLL